MMPQSLYWHKLRPILKTATFRQSVITSGSIIANGILATVFYIVAARVLGAHDYGLFSLSAMTVAIMSVVFDFGNDKGMVKFISQYGSDTDKGQKVLKAVFFTKLTSGLFFILLFTLFSHPLARILYNQPEMARLLPLTAIAFFTQLLLFFVTYYFQATERFLLWGFLFINANLVRLILLGIFYSLGWLNALTVLGLFALTPFISFIIGFMFMGFKFFKAKINQSTFSELFTFNKWAFGFSSVSTVGSRLDTFLTSRFTTLADVGIYSLANQATFIMPNLVSALGAVTSPKFARFNTAGDNRKYLIKSTLFFLGIAVIGGILLLPLGYVFMRFSGPEYLAGFAPFVLLILSQVIFLAFSPLRDSLLYYYSRPDFFFWTSLGHTAVTLASGLILLPRIGLLGAATSNLLGQIFLSLASVFMYLHLRKSN